MIAAAELTAQSAPSSCKSPRVWDRDALVRQTFFRKGEQVYATNSPGFIISPIRLVGDLNLP